MSGPYSVVAPGLGVVLNIGLQLETDPAMDGRLNEAAALMIRPGAMVYDDSGVLGDEQVMEVLLTRTQLRAILDVADQLWLDDCAACSWNPRTGKPLRRFSPWRAWASARKISWSKAFPSWAKPAQNALDRWTWRLAR